MSETNKTLRVRKHNGHTIEFRPSPCGTIASIYIDGRYEYDSLKNSYDALDAAASLCDDVYGGAK